MKTFKYITLALGCSFLMNSCYDLDRFPSDKLSSATFWKTREHADQGMMGVYSMLQEEHLYGTYFNMDLLGGIATGYDSQSLQQIARGTYTNREERVTKRFSNLYEGISRANIVIQNINLVEMDEGIKSRYTGEAKFLRAFFYAELLDLFGGVPLYDESTIVQNEFNNMLKPRSSAEETRAFILKDLEEAYNTLPGEGEWESGYKGRVTKGSAVALKGKVLLFNKQYPEAATCFETVVNSGKFALYPDYSGLFKPGGDESSEMIFAVQNMGGVGTDFGMPTTFYMGSRSSFGSCWNNVMPSTNFVDSYEWKDGRKFNWEEFEPGSTNDASKMAALFRGKLSKDSKTVETYPARKDDLRKMYEGRDPRLEASIITPYATYKGWVSNAPKLCEYVVASGVNEVNGFIRVNQNHEYYLFRKFVAEYDLDGEINNRAHTPINFPIIRYADVLLMLAECYNEMDKQPDAIALINQVRARVGMPGINSGAAHLKADTRKDVFERIRHERAVELAAEGHSFSDMKRWGLLKELDGRTETYFTREKVIFTRAVTDRDYLWPIPAEEIEKNKALKQNPGW